MSVYGLSVAIKELQKAQPNGLKAYIAIEKAYRYPGGNKEVALAELTASLDRPYLNSRHKGGKSIKLWWDDEFSWCDEDSYWWDDEFWWCDQNSGGVTTPLLVA